MDHKSTVGPRFLAFYNTALKEAGFSYPHQGYISSRTVPNFVQYCHCPWGPLFHLTNEANLLSNIFDNTGRPTAHFMHVCRSNPMVNSVQSVSHSRRNFSLLGGDLNQVQHESMRIRMTSNGGQTHGGYPVHLVSASQHHKGPNAVTKPLLK